MQNQEEKKPRQRQKKESVFTDSYSARRKSPDSRKNQKGNQNSKQENFSQNKSKEKTNTKDSLKQKAAKGVANKVAPGIGGQVVDQLSKNKANRNNIGNNLNKNLGPNVLPFFPPPRSRQNNRNKNNEEEIENEEENVEEEQKKSSRPDFLGIRNKSKKKKDNESVDASAEVTGLLKKALPFILIGGGILLSIIIVFSFIIIVLLNGFSTLLGINTETGGNTGNIEYTTSSEEEKSLYERVSKINDEYKEKGITIDPEVVGATLYILHNYNEKLTLTDMDEDMIRSIADAMVESTENSANEEENVSYNKDVFVENLKKDLLPKMLPNENSDRYENIASEIFEYIEAYHNLIEPKNNGICVEGNLQASELAKMSPTEYVNALGPVAQRDYSRTGVFASVTLAQSILESGWGKSGLSMKYNNMFGIKCSKSWKGECVSMKTQEEYTPGVYTTIMDDFRVYNSVDESLNDHSQFLKENSRYSKAGVFTASNARSQIAAIKKAGYATSSSYVSLITSLMDDYDLEKWDVTVNTTNSSSCLGTSNSGWDIRTVEPTAKDYAFTLRTGNRGQCVWYAQGRAIEVVLDLASKGLMEESKAKHIQDLLLSIYANAGDWYANAVSSNLFHGSTNIKDIKAGSIIVWKKSGWYGHVAYIEDVTDKSVTITEGWADNTTSCPNSWSCVNFKSNVKSLEEFYSSYGPYYSGNYNFVGYIYTLEPVS